MMKSVPPASAWNGSLRRTLSIGLMSSFDRSVQGGYPYAVCNSVTHKPGEVNYNDYSFLQTDTFDNRLLGGLPGKSYSINKRTAFQYISGPSKYRPGFLSQSIYFARQDMKQKMFSEELNIKSTTPGRLQNGCSVPSVSGIDNTVTLDYFTKNCRHASCTTRRPVVSLSTTSPQSTTC